MSAPYIGEIRAVGFNFAPPNWLTCDGQTLSISQYSALFQLIGTTYGGDGLNTFRLPDLRSRVMPHTQGGNGQSPYLLGQTGGLESVTLTSNQLPAHAHTYALGLAATTSGSLSDDPAGKRPAATNNNTYAGSAQGGKNLAASAVTATLANTGGGLPHSNIQPVLALNYIICVDGGYYPPQQQ